VPGYSLHRLDDLDFLAKHLVDQLIDLDALGLGALLEVVLRVVIEVDRQMQLGSLAEKLAALAL
jgi:hypothetical protein